MRYNLQFFGGRGASAGGSAKQITVNANGTTLTYRKESDGNVYSVRDGYIADKIPRTMKQIEESARKSGYEVEVLNNAQYKKLEAELRRKRKQSEEILDRASVRDKHFVKGSRMARIGNRATRRRK